MKTNLVADKLYCKCANDALVSLENEIINNRNSALKKDVATDLKN